MNDKMQKIARKIFNKYVKLTYSGGTYGILEIRDNKYPEITLWVHDDSKNYCKHYAIPFYHETYTEEDYKRDVDQMLKVIDDLKKGTFQWDV